MTTNATIRTVGVGTLVAIIASTAVAASPQQPRDPAAAVQDGGRVVSPITLAAAYRAMGVDDFALLKIAVEMQRAGRSRVDVLAELQRRRDTTRGSRTGVSVLGGIGAAAGGAAGAVTGTATGAFNPLFPGPVGAAAGGAGGGALGGALGGLAGEHLADALRARQTAVARIAQERPWEVVLHSEDYENLKAVFQAPTYWGPIWRAVYEPSVHVALDDDPVTALAKVPALEAELRDYGVYEDLIAVSRSTDGVRVEEDLDGSQERFLHAFQSAMNDFLDRAEENAAAWAAELQERDARLAGVVRAATAAGEDRGEDRAAAAYTENWAERVKREEAQRRHARYEADRANLVSLAGVALFGLTAVAPDIARGVTAFGQAVVDVSDAFHTFNRSIFVGASSTLAGAALTSNLLVAGVSFLNALSPGPTPEDLILEQLHKLTEVVRRGFRNVHAHLNVVQGELRARFDVLGRRLDGVDRGLFTISRQIADVVTLLDTMHEDIRDDFTVLQQAIGRAHGLLDAIFDGVNSLNGLVLGAYGQQTQDHLELRERVDALALQDCSTSEASLEGCLRAFYRLADRLPRLERQPDDLRVLLADYADFPAYMNRVGCEQFSTLTDQVVDCQDIVGVRQWLEIVQEWSRFVDRHGDRLQVYAVQVQQVVDRLTAYQSAREAYRQVIVDELRSLQRDGGDTAFSQQLGRNWVAHGELRETVHGLQRDYWLQQAERADGQVPGRMRLRRDDAQRSVIPELAADGPYAWGSMTDFYDEDEVPDWLEVHRYESCRFDEMEARHAALPRAGGTTGRFWTRGSYSPLEWTPALPELVNDGILGLLPEGSLMPARLGMGQLNVCARYALSDTGRKRLAVQLWFRDTATIRLEEQSCTTLLWSGKVEATRGDEVAPSLFWRAAVKSRRSAPLIDTTATNEGLSACQRRYLRAVEAERADQRRHVAAGLTAGHGSEPTTRIALDFRVSSANLRKWLDVAFGGVAGSALREAVALGFLDLPDISTTLGRHDAEPAGLVDDIARQLRRIEHVLRSPQMRDLVAYGSGDRRFIDTIVPGLPQGQ